MSALESVAKSFTYFASTASSNSASFHEASSAHVPVETVVHGDSLSASIAAASVLAKVTRDDLMLEMAKEYPQYGFDIHKGYGTKVHYEALRNYGPCPIHRMTFLKKFYEHK